MKDLHTMRKKQGHKERHHSSFVERNGNQSLSKIVFITGLFLIGCSNSGCTKNPITVNGSGDIDTDPPVSANAIENPSSIEVHDLWPDIEGEFDIESEQNELDVIESEHENEDSLPDIPVPPVLSTNEFCTYIAKRNVNCRESDYVEASLIAILLQGEGANLLYLNPAFTHGKFELLNSTQCWIYLELMDGPADPLKMCTVYVVDAPPPIAESTDNGFTAPACSKYLDQASCIGAGCNWVDGGATTGASYCH